MTAGFPLSVQQRRVWSYRQHGPRVALALRLEGELDADALRDALRAVVARHEALRTAFRPAPGLKLPLQVIEEGAQPGWEVLSADAGPSPGEDALHAALLETAAADGSDPADGPQLEARLL